MDISSARDWIIIIVGALEIIFIIGALVVGLVVYQKIKKLIEKGKETVQKIEDTVRMVEKTIASPYYKAGSWMYKTIAAVLGIFQKRKEREERAHG